MRPDAGRAVSHPPSPRLAPHLNTGVANAVSVAEKKLTALVETLKALATTMTQAGEDFGTVA